jgi:hypothetical protein
MRITTVRQFVDSATSLLKQDEPIIVTRRGKIAGFFLPTSGKALTLKIRQDLFSILTDESRSSMKSPCLTENAILADFEKTRKAPRQRSSKSVRMARKKDRATSEA